MTDEEIVIGENGVCTQTFRLAALDVDAGQKLRMSSLLRHMQEMAFEHTDLLGIGREKTLDQGILWVIARVEIEVVSRLPVYHEKITMETWAGEMMSIVFPRHFRIIDEDGNVLMRGIALWMLFDEKERKMAFPAEHGIQIEGRSEGGERKIPGALRSPDGSEGSLGRASLHTTYAEIDLNGHTNNTHYADWLDNLFSLEWHKEHEWSRLQINYLKEVPYDTDVSIRYKQEGEQVLAEGRIPSEEGWEAAFRIRAIYREATHVSKADS